jgi:serine/threonine protein kinase
VNGTLLVVGRTYGGRYEVTDFVGEGGIQEVYAANDAILDRQVALKVPKNSAAERRFQRSAVLSALVNHPNIAKTLDYFEYGGRSYLVEEFVPGITLSDARRQIPRMDPYSVAHMLHHLAKGVAASHHVSPSLTDSAAHQPQNPGFPLRWRERFKPGQALSGRRCSVVP